MNTLNSSVSMVAGLVLTTSQTAKPVPAALIATGAMPTVLALDEVKTPVWLDSGTPAGVAEVAPPMSELASVAVSLTTSTAFGMPDGVKNELETSRVETYM